MSYVSRWIESGFIGLFAGGWASCTYWEGAAGIFIGVVAMLTAMFFLTIQREEEQKNRKPASPYKKARTAGTTRA